MEINCIYITYSGEQGPMGIGHPTIFLRTAGCMLRCYFKTMGTLCDTPEALERGSGENISVAEIIIRLNEVKEKTGINLITLTGGDPLWQDVEELRDLFYSLRRNGFYTCVETSGYISMEPFQMYSAISWIIDYKTKSAGLKENKLYYNRVYEMLPLLGEKDYIKFVLYDEADFAEFVEAEKIIRQNNSKVKVAVGVYWSSSKLSNARLFELLLNWGEGSIGRVLCNFQVHKFATMADNIPHEFYEEIKIPARI